jgi:hypothetical protein
MSEGQTNNSVLIHYKACPTADNKGKGRYQCAVCEAIRYLALDSPGGLPDEEAKLGRGKGIGFISWDSSESLSSWRVPTGVSSIWLIILLWSIMLSKPRSMIGVPGVVGRYGVAEVSDEDPLLCSITVCLKSYGKNLVG